MRVTIPDGVMIRELAGESVLLNLETESYFGLDEIGTRMWSALIESESIEAACERLRAEYEVEPEKLREDVEDFVHALSESGLIALGDA